MTDLEQRVTDGRLQRRAAGLAAGLPLAALVVGLLAARPVADDLCYEASLATRGFVDAWSHYMTSWTATWLHHLVLLGLAAFPGWSGYVLQGLVLLGLLTVSSRVLAPDLRAALLLIACSLAALQGSLVGPAYPGLAGSFAWPSAAVLHLLPVLLWLPLTHLWYRRGGPPLPGAVLLVLVLAGLGTAEAGAAVACWTVLAVLSWRDGRRVLRWVLPTVLLAVLLLAVFLAPGSEGRNEALELAPSSAALDLPPATGLVAYLVLYSGGVVTSPGVLLALLLGATVLRPAPVRAAVVPVVATACLLLAQAGAAVFAYPAFWHLQGVQLAAAAAALLAGRALAGTALGGRTLGGRVLGGRVRLVGPGAPVLLAAAAAALVAFVPAVVTSSALLARAEAFEEARRSATVPAYSLGVRGGAHIPDAGDGLPALIDCWSAWTGVTPTVVPPREGPRGVLPTVPLDVLG